MADKKVDFDPIVRAESLMAKAMDARQHGDGSHTFSVPVERREQIRDLLLFSQAQSLQRIADALAGTLDGKNSGILHGILDFANKPSY